MKYDIFVSYRRADRELVASVVRRLEERGVGVWYDAEIEGGADWRETIVNALTESDMLAIFFSEDCNNSRQLKKELAVADSLGKPVVPILIENTQPRGAYLYELADRNWIQVFPDPMERIDELVEHLATLAGKTEGGLAGNRPPPGILRKEDKAPPSPKPANDVPGSGPPANDVAANDVLAAEEQPLAEAVGEFIAGADQPTRNAPKMAKAYIGRVTDPGPIRKMNDVPPFRWIDLVFLAPLFIGSGWYMISISMGVEPKPDGDRVVASAVLLFIMGTMLYGSVVFPLRYYLRRRGVLEALVKYLGSALMLFLAGVGIMLGGLRDGYIKGADFGDFFQIFGLAWVLFAVIAFVTYGILAGQRAMKSFRSNLRKIS